MLQEGEQFDIGELAPGDIVIARRSSPASDTSLLAIEAIVGLLCVGPVQAPVQAVMKRVRNIALTSPDIPRLRVRHNLCHILEQRRRGCIAIASIRALDPQTGPWAPDVRRRRHRRTLSDRYVAASGLLLRDAQHPDLLDHDGMVAVLSTQEEQRASVRSFAA